MPKKSCPWPGDDALMQAYHDQEWGVPLRDDRRLFEFLILETMQAGLSWRCVLHKRENFRKAFHRFDPAKMARYGAADIQRLLADAGIIRNRLKIESAIANAKAYLAVLQAHGSFSDYLWNFIGGKPITYRRKTLKDLPATTPESDRISKAMKADGFRFVGSTIICAHMQATGMVNDHLVSCRRHGEVGR